MSKEVDPRCIANMYPDLNIIKKEEAKTILNSIFGNIEDLETMEKRQAFLRDVAKGHSINTTIYMGTSKVEADSIYKTLCNNIDKNIPVAVEGSEFKIMLDSVDMLYSNTIDFKENKTIYKVDFEGRLV